MPLYRIVQQLEHIKETSFKFEREIQRLTEQNLQSLLDWILFAPSSH